MALKWVACCPVYTQRGKLYSFGGEQSSEIKGLGGSLKTFLPGDFITAAEVGGSAAMEELAAADAIAMEGSGDARMARKLAIARADKELGRD